MAESDLFREVDEELKREQFAKLWDQYGFLIIGAAVAIVLVVAGYKFWKTQQAEQAARYGAQYIDALEAASGKDKTKAAAQLKQIADEGPVGYATLAKLRSASLAAAEGKGEDAVAGFDALAKDGAVEPILRDFARVEAAALRIDTAEPAEIAERLGAIAEGNGAWRLSARELLALSAYRTGDLAGAEQWYNRISEDPEAPSGLKQRAEMMVSLIFDANLGKPAAAGAAPAAAAPVAVDRKGK